MRAIIAALLLVATPALAQQPPPDPRIAGPLIDALRAELALRDAAIKAMQEDVAKREKEWAEYSRPIWDLEKMAAPKANK